MLTLQLVFLIIALVLFVLATVGVTSGKYSLMAAGLAFVVAAMIAPLV